MLDSMRRHIKNTLIPHEGNDFRPHLLRAAGSASLALILLLAFAFSLTRGLLLNRGAEFTAAVLPAVLVELTNDDRADEGLAELRVNPTLEEAARMKAEHMAENGYFAHTSPDGLDPWYWFYRAGYDFVEAGENLAVNFSDSEDVQTAWMKSPGHRANIVNGKFTEIGIAAARGTYKGKSTIFVVQLFGTPMAERAAAAPAPIVAEAPSEPAAAPAAAAVAAEPATNLVKQETAARVEGATPAEPEVAAETEEGVASAQVTLWDEAAARPRATVSWVYIISSLLVSFALLLMVWKNVHTRHIHSMAYGAILLTLILGLSYLNWLFLSAELAIV